MAKLLLVEDNEMNRDMLSRRLIRKGYDIAIAVSGDEAVEKTRSENPDLVLMDISLPGMDGWEATRILKSDPATRPIPVIALTASVLPEEKDRCLAAGMSAVLGKPFSIEQLRSEVHKWLTDDAADPTQLRIS